VTAMAPQHERGGPPAAMSRPKSPAAKPYDTLIVAAGCACECGCGAQLIKALGGIRGELSRIRERLDQGESERAGWPS
jgi:hypothetical protein